MLKHINITTKSESGILLQQVSTNIFQKDKSKEEILGHRYVMTMMIQTHLANLGTLAVPRSLEDFLI